ncbi:caspase family protein [Thermocoleostomius sinensis]|uniref:Caspase family protein n=1 Tax=Thermocoleostomius sinensis A174 TaxID=2016057 RepID=A0A9E9C8W7_9CYAN|nr:caspase family protein [Thermocoleostomius sinensis]WAL61864.1 caspase family protein [Thermocoleostomius sinensis A174]
MGLKRRAFLRRSGLLMAALGISEAGLSLLAERYQQALAQPTRRKLALLVGINQYPEQVCDCALVRGNALNGCLTDVELQRELLIHRFGFQPSDILVLTDQQATRQNIEDAFLFHLTNQAQAGDVVVFHFSGLGSRIHSESPGESQTSLVPIDGWMPTDDDPTIHDLLEDTLGLLLRSLSTEQVTTILDAGYTDLGRTVQGNLRIRSRPTAVIGQPSEAELAIQEQLMSQFKLSPEQVRTQWQSGQLPGVVLTASRSNLIATEGQWNGFNAGLFTYALTQQLWWSTPATTLRTSLSLAASSVKQLSGIEQQPGLVGQKLQLTKLPAYNLTPETTDADGVIQAVDDDGRVHVWLAGLPTLVLEHYGAASVLAIVSPAAELATDSTENEASSNKAQLPLLQTRSRDGLMVKARPCCGESSQFIRSGQLVQELVRVLPRNIGLTVALDASLERIERVDATSAFSSIPRVSSVIAGEPADFLFGKTAMAQPTLTASLAPSPAPANRNYGLFSLGRDAIPNTLTQDDEAIKTAVNRITPQLRTLLALKLLRLTANRGSSRLNLQATLEMIAPQERIIMQQETVRLQPASLLEKEVKPRVYTADLFTTDGSATLPIGSRIRYQLRNCGSQPVYFILLGLDPSGNPIAFYSTAESTAILPGETLVVPQAVTEWVVQGTSGLAETHLILSRSPFTQAYQALKAPSQADVRQVVVIQNPLDVMQMVLQDLHNASADLLPHVDIPADTYALDVHAWTTFSFVYQVTQG